MVNKIITMNAVNTTCVCDIHPPVTLNLLLNKAKARKVKKLAAVKVKLSLPLSTFLVFASGKIVIVGCKTLNAVKLAVSNFCKLLTSETGTNFKWDNLEIKNSVFTASSNYKVDLNVLKERLNKTAVFEPELYPSVVVNVLKATVLIFASGKLIITGVKTKEAAQAAFANILPTIEKCQRQVQL